MGTAVACASQWRERGTERLKPHGLVVGMRDESRRFFHPALALQAGTTWAGFRGTHRAKPAYQLIEPSREAGCVSIERGGPPRRCGAGNAFEIRRIGRRWRILDPRPRPRRSATHNDCYACLATAASSRPLVHACHASSELLLAGMSRGCRPPRSIACTIGGRTVIDRLSGLELGPSPPLFAGLYLSRLSFSGRRRSHQPSPGPPVNKLYTTN